jgi:hypothetical protein
VISVVYQGTIKPPALVRSVVRCARRYNWVWYRIVTQEQLARALTSDSGERRRYSVPAGSLSQATRRELVESAGSQLPTLCALVEREPNPFVQAIFDYKAPSMVKGRIALLGMRHTSCVRIQQWECRKRRGAMTLHNCLTLDQYDSLRLVGRELLNMGGNSVRRSQGDRAGNDNCHVANDQRSRGDHNETVRKHGRNSG